MNWKKPTAFGLIAIALVMVVAAGLYINDNRKVRSI